MLTKLNALLLGAALITLPSTSYGCGGFLHAFNKALVEISQQAKTTKALAAKEIADFDEALNHAINLRQKSALTLWERKTLNSATRSKKTRNVKFR